MIENYIDLEKQIQPCGIDLTVSKIFTLKGQGRIDFSNKQRVLPDLEEVRDWNLEPGVYLATINEKINLPLNISALFLPRSSALTCGIEPCSALWDPGYKGRGMVYFTVQRKVKIDENARICQMVFFPVEETESYSGIYQNEDLMKNHKRGLK